MGQTYSIDLKKKVSSAVYGLTRSSMELDTHTQQKLLYSGLIHSHITNGLAIWGHATKDRLQELLVKQKMVIRKIHHLKYRDQTLPYLSLIHI